jgi:hypothetical protein
MPSSYVILADGNLHCSTRAIRTEQVRQLAELMERKAKLEVEIIKEVRELTGAYTRVKGEMEGVAEARMRGVQEAMGMVGSLAGVDGKYEGGEEW